MDITYCYSKKRMDFGKQPMFSEVPTSLLDSIDSNKDLQKLFTLRNPVHKETTFVPPQSEQVCNTIRFNVRDRGMNHREGGWPREIHILDEEATSRHRRKIERDEGYIGAILHTYPKFKHYLSQNNAIEMYEMYFKNLPHQPEIEKPSVVVQNVFRSPNRPVSSIAWTIEDDPKFVIAYCNRSYPIVKSPNKDFTCYVWNIESPIDPLFELLPPVACWKLTCTSYDPSVILAGLADGSVCVFDLRANSRPVSQSPFYLSHQDPVNSLIYLFTRSNSEFFTGSSDGYCKWWDMRNLSELTETLPISLREPRGDQSILGTLEAVSSLQYDKTLPTRFLCGTDTGLVININRKGKTQSEIFSSIFNAHNGPVKAIHRSPLASKIFLTCGDWGVNVWSEDVLTSPIIVGAQNRYQMTDVVWAPLRLSSYMCVNIDGKFRYWDLLRKYKEPVVTSTISMSPLLKLAAHEDGKFVAVGDEAGSVFLLSLSDNLVHSEARDKPLMVQNYERENKREHILEAKVKELKLKQREVQEAALEPVVEVIEDDSSQLIQVEEEFKRIVNDEFKKAGVENPSIQRKH